MFGNSVEIYTNIEIYIVCCIVCAIDVSSAKCVAMFAVHDEFDVGQQPSEIDWDPDLQNVRWKRLSFMTCKLLTSMPTDMDARCAFFRHRYTFPIESNFGPLDSHHSWRMIWLIGRLIECRTSVINSTRTKKQHEKIPNSNSYGGLVYEFGYEWFSRKCDI